IKLVEDLNNRDDITGFIVQLPLPKHVYTPDVIKAIDPSKDVDGFHAYNIGKLTLSSDFEHLVPCTPKGIIKMLDYYKIDVKGKDVCIVGASNIVGKPMAAMFLNRMATVSICHIETKDLTHYTKYADIVVVAVGKTNLITAEMVKDDVILIDVGINKMEDGRLLGDADFENISKKSSYITPVPGGVGPMTVACLIENTLIAYKRQNNIAI
ncbi:bifunctional 5,10-methylenetetrahydrofolate dehydrogenase/5,10-methenyltetrahydrofolate cyclohydrolase, partial [Patescibacteria group bacterium]|nr:bifunctional 5,10-methylenetetrahydrofolate dehydrogenase/5,10-methenyltetrahydrofolate cyclohydrolase [Patescibacteria group bacterium]